MSSINIDISVEKLISFLSPMVKELGTEVIQLESPYYRDADGYGYLARSRHMLYKYGTVADINEQEAIEYVANEMKLEIESKQLQKMVGNIILHTQKLGIYKVHVMYEWVKDEDLEKYYRAKETQHALIIFIRYSFGDKDRILQGEV